MSVLWPFNVFILVKIVKIDFVMSRNIQPGFHDKTVIYLHCIYCDTCLCARGMKAILLADTKVELYSTDLPPEQ